MLVCTLRGSSVTVRLTVRPSWPYAVKRNECELEQLNGRLSEPLAGYVLYTPGPSIEIVTLTALVVDQLAVNIWEFPLWQSMFSGVVKLTIVGAGAVEPPVLV